MYRVFNFLEVEGLPDGYGTFHKIAVGSSTNVWGLRKVTKNDIIPVRLERSKDLLKGNNWEDVPLPSEAGCPMDIDCAEDGTVLVLTGKTIKTKKGSYVATTAYLWLHEIGYWIELQGMKTADCIATGGADKLFFSQKNVVYQYFGSDAIKTITEHGPYDFHALSCGVDGTLVGIDSDQQQVIKLIDGELVSLYGRRVAVNDVSVTSDSSILLFDDYYGPFYSYIGEGKAIGAGRIILWSYDTADKTFSEQVLVDHDFVDLSSCRDIPVAILAKNSKGVVAPFFFTPHFDPDVNTSGNSSKKNKKA